LRPAAYSSILLGLLRYRRNPRLRRSFCRARYWPAPS